MCENHSDIEVMLPPKMESDSGKYVMDVYNFLKFLGLTGIELENAMLKWLGIKNEF